MEEYQKEDFLTSAPYEAVLSIADPFQQELAIAVLADHAKNVGISNFKSLLKAFVDSRKEEQRTVYIDNLTHFTGQPIELECGDWRADDWGISRKNGLNGDEIACPHPILPVERLVNIDTGVEKLKLAFCKGDKRWREIIAEKSVLASNQKILSLSDMGISVTSESSRAMVRYISDLENMNYQLIPERKSVSRLGYIEGEGFSPFVPGLIFDGDANFRYIFSSVQSKGNYDSWLAVARQIRQGNVMARIVLAASFASVLVAPCGALPFFVHLWGGESGTGKTVALMLAASVWASPEMGRYIQTFNSTVVGREKLAAFLNHLPLLVDELQLAKDARGKLMFDVYALAEGVGRTRGTKTGGIDKTPVWHNCILTTGESPITGSGSGAGAINRVIEIECKTSQKIIEDGHGVSAELKRHYGFAGRNFVERLYGDNGAIEEASSLYRKYFREFSENDTTEKQSMAAAIIATADELATRWIFHDGRALTSDELGQFLASREAVSAGSRGYRYMCDWVSQNSNKMQSDNERGDVYGLIDGEWAYVIGSTFRRAAEEGGYSASSLLSWLRDRNLIQTRGRAMTKNKRINGVSTECVCMRIDDGNCQDDNDCFEEIDEFEI